MANHSVPGGESISVSADLRQKHCPFKMQNKGKYLAVAEEKIKDLTCILNKIFMVTL